jgi:dTMP kinase
MKKGKFIVIDGGDGSGKSTQLNLLRKQYPDAVFTREPGGTPYAEEFRNALLNSVHADNAPTITKLLLFFAGRADHIKNLIIPSLEQGKIVISDRFDSSTFAYQLWGEGKQEYIPEFLRLRETIVSACLPDVYLYLDVDPEESKRRKSVQKDEILNYLDHAPLEEVIKRREGYFEFFKTVNPNYRIIDANRDIETVFKDINSAIDSIA